MAAIKVFGHSGGGVFAAENQDAEEIVVESGQEGEAEDQEKDTLPENPTEGENSGDADASQEIGSDEAEPKEDGTEVSEGTETSGEAGETGETGGDETQGDSEEDVMPTVEAMTLEYVPGKVVEIPVTMGSGQYAATGVNAGGELVDWYEYDREKGIVRVRMREALWWYLYKKEVKRGDYEVNIKFNNYDTSFEYENKDVKIHLETDSKPAHLIKANYVVDGTKDVVYRFENGTGAFELKEITSVWAFETPNDLTDRSQFTYDLEKGILIIKGNVIENFLYVKFDDFQNTYASLGFKGKTVQGGTVSLNYGDDDGEVYGCWRLTYEPAITNPTHVEPYENNGVITNARMQELVEVNKEKDVVINTPSWVTFRFAKGTMHLVKGIENYAFGVDLINEYSKSGITNSKVTADNFVLRINYEYSGELPGTAKISIPVDSKWNGKTLYYYQIKSDGTLKDTGKSGEVTDGTFNVEQTHCSDYVLLSSSPKELGIASATSNTQATKAPQTGDSNMVLLYGLLCMGALAAGICAAATRRKSN